MCQWGAKGTHGRVIEWSHPWPPYPLNLPNRGVKKSPPSEIAAQRLEIDIMWGRQAASLPLWWWPCFVLLSLNKAITSWPVIVFVSGVIGWMGGNAFRASQLSKKRWEVWAGYLSPIPQTGVEKSQIQSSANLLQIFENVTRTHLRTHRLAVLWCREQSYSFRQAPNEWTHADRAPYVRSLSGLITIVMMMTLFS